MDSDDLGFDEYETLTEEDENTTSSLDKLIVQPTQQLHTRWLLEKNVEDYNWLGEGHNDVDVNVPIFNTNGITYPTIHNDMRKTGDTHYNDLWPLTYKTNFSVNIKDKFDKISSGVYDVLGGHNKILKHQAVIQRFMSPHSINRGLLLYHKVGSGKTLSSILVAEDHYKMMREIHNTLEKDIPAKERSRFDVMYLIPATLRKNTEEEINKWSKLYRTHYGDTVKISSREHKIFHYNSITLIPYIKSLPDQYFEKARPSYADMDIDKWINTMLTDDTIPIEVNPLRNKLYIIDEIHNVVSLMKNETKKQEFLFKFFMNMRNCKILAMSGTPVRKDPYEMAILMNILKGRYGSGSLFPLNPHDFRKKFGITSQQTRRQQLTDEQGILLKRMMTGMISYYSGSKKGVPDVVYHPPIRVTMSKQQQREYDMFFDLEEGARMALSGNKRGNVRQLQHIHSGSSEKFTRSPTNVGVFRTYTRQVSNFSFPTDVIYPIKRPIKRDFFDMLKYVAKVEDLSDYTAKLSEALRLIFNESEFEQFMNENTPIEVKSELLDNATKRHLRILRSVIPENTNKKIAYTKFMSDIYTPDIVRAINIVFGENSRLFYQCFKDLRETMKSTENYSHKIRKAFANIIGLKKPGDIYNDKKYFSISPLDKLYATEVNKSLLLLDKLKYEYLKNTPTKLKQFSPKMSEMIKNIETYDGKAFVYSNFVRVEGIHVFAKILEANGYIKLSVVSYAELLEIMNKNLKDDEKYPTYSKDNGTYENTFIEFDESVYNSFTYKLDIEVLDQKDNVFRTTVTPIELPGIANDLIPKIETKIKRNDNLIRLLQSSRNRQMKRHQDVLVKEVSDTTIVYNKLVYTQIQQNVIEYEMLIKQNEPHIKDINVIKGRYIIYTGSEDSDVKNKLKTLFNHVNNTNGEYIRILLGSGAASEGITLKGVKQVHITEPTWVYTQTEQIIGRAVRINSHIDIPEKERLVHVFEYHSVSGSGESTDLYIYETSKTKHDVANVYLRLMKECAIDFGVYDELKSEIEKEHLIQYLPSEETDILYAPDIGDIELVDRKYRVGGHITVCYVPIELPSDIDDKTRDLFIGSDQTPNYYIRHYKTTGKLVNSLLKHNDPIKGTAEFGGYILYKRMSEEKYIKSVIIYESNLVDASSIKVISSIYKPDKNVIEIV